MFGTLRITIGLMLHPSTLFNLNISESSNCWPIAIKFYMKSHWIGRKAAVGSGADWIETLVCMVTKTPFWGAHWPSG